MIVYESIEIKTNAEGFWSRVLSRFLKFSLTVTYVNKVEQKQVASHVIKAGDSIHLHYDGGFKEDA